MHFASDLVRRNERVERIVYAASEYAGCLPTEVLASDWGTRLVRRVRALAYAFATEDSRLSAMSEGQLIRDLGKHDKWTVTVKRHVEDIRGTQWYRDGVEYIRKRIG